MTDNEIKKALEYCFTREECSLCPLFRNCPTSFELQKQALELINRLQAENERLKADCDKIAEDYSNLMIEKDELFDETERLIKSAKAEAIKGVQDKLIERFKQLEHAPRTNRKTIRIEEVNAIVNTVLQVSVPNIINQVVKEMVGEE